MDYTVAVDEEGSISEHYMERFRVGGIPHAFVINKNKEIVWHGHPMEPLFESTIEKCIETTPTSSVKTYTVEELNKMNIKELQGILTSRGYNASNFLEKSDLIQAIQNFTNK